jgi:hypothetical protein
VAAAGCDTFRPRRAEAPLGPPIVRSYAAPESTLDTMKRGVEDRTQQGVNAYVDGLADSSTDHRAFYADMDPNAQARWQQDHPGQSPPASWTIDRERNFISLFMTRVVTKSTCVMDWSEGRFPDQPGPTEGLYFRKYAVYTLSTDTGEPDDTLAIGYATLTITQVSPGRWAITRWRDEVDPDVGVEHPTRPNWQSFTSRRLETF